MQSRRKGVVLKGLGVEAAGLWSDFPFGEGFRKAVCDV